MQEHRKKSRTAARSTQEVQKMHMSKEVYEQIENNTNERKIREIIPNEARAVVQMSLGQVRQRVAEQLERENNQEGSHGDNDDDDTNRKNSVGMATTKTTTMILQ